MVSSSYDAKLNEDEELSKRLVVSKKGAYSSCSLLDDSVFDSDGAKMSRNAKSRSDDDGIEVRCAVDLQYVEFEKDSALEESLSRLGCTKTIPSCSFPLFCI